jgi:hypothetical protein
MQRRVFVVGCPRSGTTLVQWQLSRHPGIVTFPESHLFTVMHPRNRAARRLGLASNHARAALARFFEVLRAAGHDAPDPRRWPVTVAGLSREFVRVLDGIAAHHRKDAWLEKTPDHVVRAALISRHVPGARFVHVLRRGVDVVGSLFHVTHAYPQPWGGAWSLDLCIDKWLTNVRESARWLGRDGHVFLRYDELVAAPDRRLREVISFLGLDADVPLGPGPGLDAIRTDVERWKDGADEPVAAGRRKVQAVLTAAQVAYVEREISRRIGETGLPPAYAAALAGGTSQRTGS